MVFKQFLINLCVQVSELLLDHGADPNISDENGATPLHRAASKGNLEIVKLLLQFNCRIDAMDRQGNTPL